MRSPLEQLALASWTAQDWTDEIHRRIGARRVTLQDVEREIALVVADIGYGRLGGLSRKKLAARVMKKVRRDLQWWRWHEVTKCADES
jgi:hypothetical protein